MLSAGQCWNFGADQGLRCAEANLNKPLKTVAKKVGQCYRNSGSEQVVTLVSKVDILFTWSTL